MTNAILGNWQISGITQFVSGAPLQVVGGAGNFRMDGTDADGVDAQQPGHHRVAADPGDAGADVRSRGAAATSLARAECFAAPSPGQNGNFIWPNIEGPSYINHDFSLFKNFPIGGNKKVQFRLSAYNVFNHPQRAPDDAHEPGPDVRERRPDQRQLRAAADGQQVRPPDHPAGVQVLLLNGG